MCKRNDWRDKKYVIFLQKASAISLTMRFKYGILNLVMMFRDSKQIQHDE